MNYTTNTLTEAPFELLKMEQLPLEIIEKILSSPQLSIFDVINFSSSCSYFREAVLSSTAIWKQKYKDCWPELPKFFTKDFTAYFEEIQYVFNLKKRMYALLETMPTRFYKKYELSDADLEEWGLVLHEKEQTYYYLISMLFEIWDTHDEINSIEVVPLNTPGNKTLQYYASKVLRYVKQLHLSEEWHCFINLPQKLQTLEQGAIFVAAWCQPHMKIVPKRIGLILDSITNLVKDKVWITNPNHPIFKSTPETLMKWTQEILEEHQWGIRECRQIISAMHQVIFEDLAFSCNPYYIPHNCLINFVLETRTGRPITLAIVYESVGRRLGVVFELVNHPALFLLRYLESPTHWYYIDLMDKGNMIERGGCRWGRPATTKNLHPAVNAVHLVERLAQCLEDSSRQFPEPAGRVTRLRSILELLKLVSPQDLTALLRLVKLYILHNMNTKSLETYIMTQTFNAPEQAQKILHMLQHFSGHYEQSELELLYFPKVNRRTDNVKFAVGMIMTNTTRNFNKCVIFDWDHICLPSPEPPRNKHQQPHYNVLFEDGSHKFVAQEYLVPCAEAGSLQFNPDLGRYFSHFFQNHFVPNAEKEKEYPDDAKVRHKFYHDFQLIHYTPY